MPFRPVAFARLEIDPWRKRFRPEPKTAKIRACLGGFGGYTGAELVRLLIRHPRVETRAADGRSPRPGQENARRVSAIRAILRYRSSWRSKAVDWKKAGLDLVFCALPHATTQKK